MTEHSSTGPTPPASDGAPQQPVYPRVTALPERRVPASVRFPQIEERILKYWDADGTFQASIDHRPAEDEFVFYDGPPFANGLPHYGHLLTGYVKDLVPRYQTMRGKRVERRFGWDTHGLPAELAAMKELGMSDKAEIESLGIENFNDACRSNVLKFTKEWESYVTRQARWVDFDNDYKTLNVEFMESVIWAFKQLHEKGLTYQGFRVLPYCWKDETPLSNHELRMDDEVYKDRQDPSVTVSFPVTGGGQLGEQLVGVNLLAWTTTPWTLPTNFSIAVGPEIRYAVVEAPADGPMPGQHMLAADLVGAYAKDLGFTDSDETTAAEAAEAAVVSHHTGAELTGLRYQPLWDYYSDTEEWGTQHAWQVLAEDYITTTDGTGLVHQASAYGEEDQRSSEENGIPVILSVDAAGKFLPMFAEPTPTGDAPLAEIAAVQAFDANRTIINRLKADQRLVREQSYVHSYPHCWRCRTPLMYKAVTSWYVAVTQIKDRMLQHNEQINWIPENVKHGQFGRWLENARDWSISRNRYWGSPIPVWVSDDPNHPRTEVYGSLDELKEAFGDYPRNAEGEPDLHRPWIDQLTRPNPDDPTGRSKMVRVEDVLDVWFDSGSMQFAQVHYPFENREWFEDHHPADFIVEYIGQTRGWFYTLHILATALFDRPAFSTCVSHGIVLGNDGQKMSKSLRNYPDVREVFDRSGSDAMRWFLMASPILRGGNLVVTEDGIRDAVRTILLPLWSTWYFFSLYANTCSGGEGYRARRITAERVEQLGEMDQYLLARTHDLAVAVTEAMDAYDIAAAAESIRDHLDVLTNWYVRTQRDRFWAEDTGAYDTLWTALEVLSRLMAPLAPMLTEEIWRGLTGQRSVHLTEWPVHTRSDGVVEVADGLVPNPDLVAAMDQARVAVSATHGLRKAHQLRVRQPLRRVYVAVAEPETVRPFTGLIAEELNVKEVELLLAGDDAAHRFGVATRLSVNARAAGPRLGKDVQTAIKAARAGDWSERNGTVVSGGVELHDGEYELVTEVTGDDDGEQAVSVLPGGGFVVLELALDDDLRAEGYARDVVRQVQEARKNAGLHVADRISLTLTAPAQWADAVSTHLEFIAAETLATSVRVRSGNGDLQVDLAKAEVGTP